MEKNSLLVYRIGGGMDQILGDDAALYLVPLGDMRDPEALSRALDSPAEFVSDAGMERVPKSEVQLMRIRRGRNQTELCLCRADGQEQTWRMNERMPDEAMRTVLNNIELFCEEMSEEEDPLDESDPDDVSDGIREWFESEAAESEEEWATDPDSEEDEEAPDAWLPQPAEPDQEQDVPPARGGQALAVLITSALALLSPLLWWWNHGLTIPEFHSMRALLWLNLCVLPMGLVVLARAPAPASRRFRAIYLLWLIPGIVIMLSYVKVNIADYSQLLIPCAAVAALAALFYALLCGEGRKWKRVAVVMVVCMLTYSPGVVAVLNSGQAETVRTSSARIVRIREDWVELSVEGSIRRFYVSPMLSLVVSESSMCTLRLCRGTLGVEYWVVEPRVTYPSI